MASGSAAAAAGGYAAVLAMANTSPVTDTAEAAERVLDLGRACGLVDVQPVGAVSKGAGRRGARRARSDGPVAGLGQVFSDDGKCVQDARLMRRALEYVRAPSAGRLAALPGHPARRRQCVLSRGDLRTVRPARLAERRRGGRRRP